MNIGNDVATNKEEIDGEMQGDFGNSTDLQLWVIIFKVPLIITNNKIWFLIKQTEWMWWNSWGYWGNNKIQKWYNRLQTRRFAQIEIQPKEWIFLLQENQLIFPGGNKVSAFQILQKSYWNETWKKEVVN